LASLALLSWHSPQTTPPQFAVNGLYGMARHGSHAQRSAGNAIKHLFSLTKPFSTASRQRFAQLPRAGT